MEEFLCTPEGLRHSPEVYSPATIILRAIKTNKIHSIKKPEINPAFLLQGWAQ